MNQDVWVKMGTQYEAPRGAGREGQAADGSPPPGSAVQKVRPVCRLGFMNNTYNKASCSSQTTQGGKERVPFPEHVNIQHCSPPTAFL